MTVVAIEERSVVQAYMLISPKDLLYPSVSDLGSILSTRYLLFDQGIIFHHVHEAGGFYCSPHSSSPSSSYSSIDKRSMCCWLRCQLRRRNHRKAGTSMSRCRWQNYENEWNRVHPVRTQSLKVDSDALVDRG